jgi:hypothetical protein
MTRSDFPADQTARADGAHNFAAECRLAEKAAIARAEAAEQRVAALERQVRALSAISLPVDYAVGPSTCARMGSGGSSDRRRHKGERCGTAPSA